MRTGKIPGWFNPEEFARKNALIQQYEDATRAVHESRYYELADQRKELSAIVRDKQCRQCQKSPHVKVRTITTEPPHILDPRPGAVCGCMQERYISCGCYPDEPELQHLESIYEQYRRGGVMAVHTANVVERQLQKRARRRGILPTTEVVAQADVEKHLTTFGTLGNGEIDKAMTMVKQYGFSPQLHLTLYQGRVTVNVDGQFWWARQHSRERFDIITKPIPNADKAQYGIAPIEIGCIAEIYRVGSNRPACTGFGRASRDGRNPVARGSAVEAQHPYRMAEKRAEAQALRKWLAIGDVQLPDDLAEAWDEAEAVEDVVWDTAVDSQVSPRPANVDSDGVIVDDMPEPVPPPDYGPFETWVNTCPVHSDPWVEGKFGVSHTLSEEQKLADDTEAKSCYFATVSQRKAVDLMQTIEAVKEWMAENHPGKVWRNDLTWTEQLEAIAKMALERDRNDLFPSTA